LEALLFGEMEERHELPILTALKNNNLFSQMKFFSRNNHINRKGFTLAESVIAMGILVVLITGFLAVFGPATTAIRRTLSAQEASRLQAALELELTTLRAGLDKQRYDSSLEKAFDYVASSHDQGRTILVYNYRGSLSQTRSDGSAEPESDPIGTVGEDFLIQPMVRRLDDPLLEEDFEALVGRVFFVKMTQLVYQNEELRVVEEPGEITDPHDPSSDFTSNAEEYPEAVLLVEAQFFILPTRSLSYVQGAFDPNRFTRPVFRRNLGIMR
jgi:type II secretory pathway pseudopilin PulG